MTKLRYLADYTDEIVLTDDQALEKQRRFVAKTIEIKKYAVEHGMSFRSAGIRLIIKTLNEEAY